MGDAQSVAAFGPAALQDITAIGRGHPVAEAVGLHFVPNFRLISAFHRAYPLCSLQTCKLTAIIAHFRRVSQAKILRLICRLLDTPRPA